MKPKNQKLIIPGTLVSPNRLPEPEALIRSVSQIPKRLIIDTDNHHEIVDKRWQDSKLRFAQDIRADGWLNLGDNYDFHFLSRYDKDPYRGQITIQKEFDSAKYYWQEITKLTKNVHYILGNHEYRLHKLIDLNPGFFGLKAFENFGELAGLPKEVKVYDYGTNLRIGHVWGEHGDQIRGQTNPCKWALENRNGRVRAFGHYHRAASLSRTELDETGKRIVREAYNVGHGTDERYHKYAGTIKNWQMGFLFVEHFTIGGRLHYTCHHVKSENGAFAWQGKVYRG